MPEKSFPNHSWPKLKKCINKKNKKALPAEWHPQSAVQITWPNMNTDWADMLDEVEKCYQQIALEISKRQVLLVVCENPDETQAKLAHCLQQNLRFAQAPINDTWARDHGGITILVKMVVHVSWILPSMAGD
jgi:agmatine deiminase